MCAGFAFVGVASRDARCGTSSTRAGGACGHAESRRRVETAHRVAGRGAVGGADTRVLIRVRGDVSDKFLRGESEETGEVRGGLVGTGAWGWKTGEGEVVSCYGVGDLLKVKIM